MAFVGPEDGWGPREENAELAALEAHPEIRIVLNGHTHQRMVQSFARLTVVNAGTICRRHEQGAVLLDLASGEVSWLGLRPGRPTEEARLGSLLQPTTPS